MYAFWLRRLCNDALETSGFDEVGFSAIPLSKDFMRRGATENARVNEAGETDTRNVSRRAEDALEVPDCLCTCKNGQLGRLDSKADPYASG
jgi:hypothetical protein